MKRVVWSAALLWVSSVAAAQTTAQISTVVNIATGAVPVPSLVQAMDGSFYGTTETGGANQLGSIYRATPLGAVITLYSFTGSSDGGLPVAGLTIGPDGNLYGTTLTGGANGFGGVFSLSLAGTLTVVHSFDPGADGNSPNAALAIGPDGSLYGTLSGGVPDAATGGYSGGTIFVVKDGVYSDLYSFPADSSLGQQPAARLLVASDGNLWGATSAGAANGYGNIFSYALSGANAGALTDIYDLTAADGSVLNGLTEVNGVLYGVTFPAESSGNGEIFSFPVTNPSFAVTYAFTGAMDGGSPATALYAASDGNLYGATQSGGANGSGTIFLLAATAAAPVTLASFPAGTVNSLADGALLESTDGSLWAAVEFEPVTGLSAAGMNGAGAVFRVLPAYASTPPAPVMVSASNLSPQPGTNITLTWQAANTGSLTSQSCFALGSWSGVQPAGGSVGVAPASGVDTYALTCGGNVTGAVTITAGLPPVTVTLTGPATVVRGQTAALAFAVNAPAGAPVATGSVTLIADRQLTLITLPLSRGHASLNAPTGGYPPGTYSLTAQYSGDAHYGAATSAALSVTLTPDVDATTTTLSVAPNPVLKDAIVTLTATATRSTSPGKPIGAVQFWCGPEMLAQASLNSGGSASVSARASVTKGNYPVVAKYLGDAADSASTSSVENVTVN